MVKPIFFSIKKRGLEGPWRGMKLEAAPNFSHGFQCRCLDAQEPLLPKPRKGVRSKIHDILEGKARFYLFIISLSLYLKMALHIIAVAERGVGRWIFFLNGKLEGVWRCYVVSVRKSRRFTECLDIERCLGFAATCAPAGFLLFLWCSGALWLCLQLLPHRRNLGERCYLCPVHRAGDGQVPGRARCPAPRVVSSLTSGWQLCVKLRFDKVETATVCIFTFEYVGAAE